MNPNISRNRIIYSCQDFGIQMAFEYPPHPHVWWISNPRCIADFASTHDGFYGIPNAINPVVVSVNWLI